MLLEPEVDGYGLTRHTHSPTFSMRYGSGGGVPIPIHWIFWLVPHYLPLFTSARLQTMVTCKDVSLPLICFVGGNILIPFTVSATFHVDARLKMRISLSGICLSQGNLAV